MYLAEKQLPGYSLRVTGRYEYVMGFGHHYQAQPAVVMRQASTLFEIQMAVTNLASVAMPLQYMCHMNYAIAAVGYVSEADVVNG